DAKTLTAGNFLLFFAPLRELCAFARNIHYGVNSNAPISIAPNTGRACAVPTASAVWNGGKNAGGNNGLMNGWPAGLCGAPLPVLTSGLVDDGRKSRVAMLTNPGLAPVMVPVHAV